MLKSFDGSNNNMTDGTGIPAPGNTQNFSADEVIIYGIKLNNEPAATPSDIKRMARLNVEGDIDLIVGGSQKLPGVDPTFLLPTDFQIVAAYGYAVEGHCYRFDKPRVLGFKAGNGDDKNIGCGFDLIPGTGNPGNWYKAWRLNANKRIIEMSTSVAELKSLVLDASLPGKRAPNTYRSDMQLAHRGGRLTST